MDVVIMGILSTVYDSTGNVALWKGLICSSVPLFWNAIYSPFLHFFIYKIHVTGRNLFWDILSVAFRISKQWTTQRILNALPIELIRIWDENILIHFSYKRVEVVRDIGFHLTINTNQGIYGKNLLCNIMWMHNLFVEQNVKITPTFSTPSSISVRLTSCLAHPPPPSPLPHVNVDYCFCQRAVSRIFSMHFHDLLWLPLGPIFASSPQQLHQNEEPPTPTVHFIFVPWELNSSLNSYNYTMTLWK